MAETKPGLAPWCPTCGPMEQCDEHGCCVSCGATMLSQEVYDQIIAAEKTRIMKEIKTALRPRPGMGRLRGSGL